jgi:hypothetical protein
MGLKALLAFYSSSRDDVFSFDSVPLPLIILLSNVIFCAVQCVHTSDSRFSPQSRPGVLCLQEQYTDRSAGHLRQEPVKPRNREGSKRPGWSKETHVKMVERELE